MLEAEIIQLVSSMNEDLINFRRSLHEHPEVSFEEKETTKKIVDELSRHGLKAETFNDLTGCVVRLGSSDDNNAILLRADIDALPLQDNKSCEYRSKVAGKMHACGHDVHSTILVGALSILSKMENLKRPIVGLFQPAEEVGLGARAVVNMGVLNGVGHVLGLHVEPNLPVGTISIKPGPMCACVIEFNLEFQGKSAHGARPYLGHDTILCASQFISECYSLIPRKIDARDPHVITFGAINGGTRANIIAESCIIKATIRAFNTDTARKVLEEVKRVAEGICIIHETSYHLDILLNLPAVVTDPHIADSVIKGATSVLGSENVIKDFPTSLGGEDFGVYLEHLKGGMFRLGVASPGKDAPALHAQNFDVDEEVIAVGVKVLVSSVLEINAKY